MGHMDLNRSPLATESKTAAQLNAACVNENQNESQADERLTHRLTRFLTNRRDIIAADLIAGVTVSMVAIPQSLAYAQLAGVPPIRGLYAAFLPTIVGALFGSSKLLSTGPVAM